MIDLLAAILSIALVVGVIQMYHSCDNGDEFAIVFDIETEWRCASERGN